VVVTLPELNARRNPAQVSGDRLLFACEKRNLAIVAPPILSWAQSILFLYIASSGSRMRFVLACALLWTVQAQARVPSGGDGVNPSEFADDLPLVQRGIIEQQLRNTQAHLHRAGLLAPATAANLQLQWPLQPQPGYPYDGYYGISNFVDHDARFPDQVQDYNCGARTYDTDDGYNHAGTDYFLWPTPWRTMDEKQVAIVAAAPGVIIGRSDFNPDRSCAMSNLQWNAVYVRHADGTVAWYGHMKSGSLTLKGVGENVATGETLGFVGSSGSSTGPHLHFELHDASGNVIDPRHGPCSGGPDYWAELQPYETPAINSLSLMQTAPDMMQCGVRNGEPVHEELSETDAFLPGTTLFVMATYRDQRAGQASTMHIRRPDGSVFQQWSFDLAESGLPNPFYAATYWYWSYNLPADAPTGIWRFEATYQGHDSVKEFFVGDPTLVRRLRVQHERAQAIELARPSR
jgi:murein DD-endopeptidase MepM/ murein hydrolase activator NlpD